jgi:hypothetical protein
VSTLLGVAGAGAAASLLSKTAAAATSAANVALVDTVLGSPRSGRTGDLATKSSADIGTGVLVVVAKGCVTAGDGGGGVFYWDAAIATGDDGGTVIVPSSSNGTGRWVRVWDGPLDVKWFGAVGNGVANDSAAIQAAYDAAAARLGATVYFPAGTYIVSTPIVIGITPPSPETQVSINTIGDGPVRTVIAWSGSGSVAAGPALKYYENVGARMSGITFSCTTAINQNPIGLQLAGPDTGGTTSNMLVFEQCAWGNFYIGLDAGDGSACASEIVLVNCEFGSCTYGFRGEGGGNTCNVWFHGCSFSFNDYGAFLGTAGNVHFWGGGSHGNQTATIAAFGAWQPTLRVEGFRFEIAAPEVAILDCPPELVVENCIFAANPVPTYAVIQSGYGSAIIRGCQFGGPGDEGWLTFSGGPVSLEMVNNVIYGTVPFAANVTYETKYSLFGNVVAGALGSINTALYGVANGSNVGRVVNGNMVDDVVNGSATFPGAGTVAVVFPSPREDATYAVTISGNMNQTFWVTKSVTPPTGVSPGFTLHSSDATSTATVDWTVRRLAQGSVAPA